MSEKCQRICDSTENLEENFHLKKKKLMETEKGRMNENERKQYKLDRIFEERKDEEEE